MDDELQDEGGEQQPGEDDVRQRDPVPYGRFREVVQQRNEVRIQLQELREAQREAEEEAAREAGEFERLYTEAQPRLEQLDAYESTIGEMLEARLEQVPENMRELVPEGSSLARLRWLERAAAAGVLGGEQSPPRTSPGVPPSGRRQSPPPVITRQQMSDPAWVREHAEEIREAAAEGRLER